MWRNASATTNTFVYGANATDVERTLTMEHVGFINNGASAFKTAQCVQFGATQTVGQVTLDPDCYSQNVTKISTTTGVFVTRPSFGCNRRRSDAGGLIGGRYGRRSVEISTEWVLRCAFRSVSWARSDLFEVQGN